MTMIDFFLLDAYDKNMETNQSNQKSLFGPKAIENIKKAKSVLQKATLWTFIGGVIVSAFLILFSSTKEGEIVGKLVGTLFSLAAMMLISIVNFKGMESKFKSAQIFGVVGLVANVIFSFLWILYIWEIVSFSEPCTYSGLFYRCDNIFTFAGSTEIVASCLSGIGFFGSIICMLYEGTRRSVIRPLKITALICLIYADVYYAYIMLSFGDIYRASRLSDLQGRLMALAGFASFVFLVTLIIAAILAKQEKNKIFYADNKKKQQLVDHAISQLNNKDLDSNNNEKMHAPNGTYDEPMTSSEDEIRAEIEAKVRREMEEKAMRERIEKEVREKVEKEMKEKAE